MTHATELLREARSRSGLTQVELARRAGLTQSVISDYERGRREPSFSTLSRLVAASGLDLSVTLVEPAPPSREAGGLREHHRHRAQHGRDGVELGVALEQHRGHPREHAGRTPPSAAPARRVRPAATLACALVLGGCSFSGGVQGSGAASTAASPTPGEERPEKDGAVVSSPSPATPDDPSTTRSPTTPPPGGAAAPSPDTVGLERCTTSTLDVSVVDVSAAAGSAPARRDVVLRNTGQAGARCAATPASSSSPGPTSPRSAAPRSAWRDTTPRP